MLTLKGLTKQIGGLRAVNGVDLSVKENEIVGLVGPNGAGKTTLLNMISGISPPSAGTVTFLSEDITGLKADRICKKGITKTFQIAESFPGLTARECTMIGALFGNHRKISMADAGKEAIGILDFVGFPAEKRETRIRNLNVVELKRVQLARALASKPKLLLLDEPTAGVDPKARRDFWEQIHQLAGQGLTCLIATHYMDEAERCHRLAYIGYGKLLTHGTVAEVIDQAHLTTWSVTGPNLLRLAEQLRSCPGVEQTVAFGSMLHVSGDDATRLEQAVAPFRTSPYEWRRISSGLEDVFIHLMDQSPDNYSS